VTTPWWTAELAAAPDRHTSPRLPEYLAAKGYSGTFRIGHLVIGFRRLGCTELHPFHVPPPPQHWTQIWPAFGHKPWPPRALNTTIRMPPLGTGFRQMRSAALR
jgi:hypothetical protein